MELKEIVREICEAKSNKRVDYIVNFLKRHNINYNLINYQNGINIEFVKTGSNPEKEVIFFAHHDISIDTIEGANDNTSSVAVMLAVIKYLYFNQPHYTVKVVFNDREEILGGLINNYSMQKAGIIIDSVGSFNYLMNANKELIKVVFILELSGVGDSLYFASSSGNIECSKDINGFLRYIAGNKNYKFLNLPIGLSDFVSVHSLGLKGTVLGAIPYLEGKAYFDKTFNQASTSIKEIYPHVWKKNHTSMDKFFSIQEKSLEMVYNFVIEIIINLDKL